MKFLLAIPCSDGMREFVVEARDIAHAEERVRRYLKRRGLRLASMSFDMVARGCGQSHGDRAVGRSRLRGAA